MSVCEYKIRRIIDDGVDKIIYYTIYFLTQIPSKDEKGRDTVINIRKQVMVGEVSIPSNATIKDKMYDQVMQSYWRGLSEQQKIDESVDGLYLLQIP